MLLAQLVLGYDDLEPMTRAACAGDIIEIERLLPSRARAPPPGHSRGPRPSRDRARAPHARASRRSIRRVRERRAPSARRAL